MKDVELRGREILHSLKTARWDTALRTYGNNHSTLIGLLVDWWVSGDHERRWALESGPANGCAEPGVRGQSDALFCSEHDPLGVLEVEGSRHQQTARKIGTFFEARYKESLAVQVKRPHDLSLNHKIRKLSPTFPALV